MAPQKRDALGDETPIVGVEGRAAGARRELRKRDPADDQAVVYDGPMDGDMLGLVQDFVVANKSEKSALSVLRSIFPFGFRGRGPFLMSTLAGTMKAGRRSRQAAISDDSSIAAPSFNATTAMIPCPRLGCGTPKAAASPTS